jgi:hypothetical protein
MAIKDLVAPGFVGTSSIKFIVTRGVLGATTSVGGGAWRFESEDFSVPKFTIEDMNASSLLSEDMSVPKFTTESLKRS